VRFKKMNASEPSMTCRNDKDDIKTEVGLLLQEESGRYLVTAQAVSGIEVA
jgi:metal-dependent hydrolase (beta-lactamase superfamily II)